MSELVGTASFVRLAELATMLDESKRQRAVRPEVRVSQQALGIVQPINRRIAGWQLNVARLIALGRKLRMTGGSGERLRAETEALSAQVLAETQALRQRQSELPPAVANSSRMIDTARALGSLAKGLEQALAVLPRRGSAKPDEPKHH